MISLRSSHFASPTWMLLAALVGAGTAGCASWKTEPASPKTLLAWRDPPREMRLTLADGSTVEIHNPVIRGDSLVGAEKAVHGGRLDWKGALQAGAAPAETRVALTDIRRVEIMKVDRLATAVAVAAGVGATVVIIAIIASDKKDSPPPSRGPVISCPLIYSHDGQDWTLDSGTFGGAFLRSLAYTDYDILEALKPSGGALRVRLQAGDQETDHIDELTILAVDHDPSVTIATDSKGGVHTIVAPMSPISARDSRGRDALPEVRASDDRSWESALAVRDTALASDVRETLILEFGRTSSPGPARLILRANKTAWAAHLMRSFVAAHGTATTKWYAAMNAEPARAAVFRRILEDEVHLNVLVWEKSGWVGQASVWGGGPEIQKTHAVPLDLSRAAGDVIRIRLESAPSFWLVDWVALDTQPERPFQIREVAVRSAFVNDGRDAAPPLRGKDADDLVLRTGDAVAITLEAPPLPPGMARTYLSRTTGWYRFHAPETGPPDSALLDRLLHEPRGISKMSITWMNASLRSLASSN